MTDNPQPVQPIPQEPSPPVIPMQTKKSIHPLVIVLLGVLLFGIGGIGGYYLATKPLSFPAPTACTMEAKLCPDGSSVGRTGPNCEFAPCPASVPNLTADWQSYTFSPLQLNFKVPPELSVHSEVSNPGNDFTAYIQNYSFNNSVPSKNAYQLYIIWQKTSIITESEFQQLKSDLLVNSIEDTTIDGYKAIKGQIKGERNRYVTYILKGNTKISLFTSEPTLVNKERTDQILSTFKFMYSPLLE